MVPFGQVPKVTVRLVVQAGNVYEGKDQVWLADLTGRMLQEGTDDARPADALARELAGDGRRAGRRASGPTRANSRRGARRSAAPKPRGSIAEVARDPRFPGSELARVKAALARDLAIQKSTPQAQAQEKFHELIYGDHPYGRLFPTEAMLVGYTLEQVQAFHQARFGPAASRLYVAGVFDAAAMEAGHPRRVRDAGRGSRGSRAGAASRRPRPAASRSSIVRARRSPRSPRASACPTRRRPTGLRSR